MCQKQPEKALQPELQFRLYLPCFLGRFLGRFSRTFLGRTTSFFICLYYLLSRSRSKTQFFFQAHLKLPLINSFMASSVYIIIFMTINRYISIYKPTDFQRLHTAQNAKIHISLSFLAGIFLHIPLCFQNKVVLIENGTCNISLFMSAQKHIFIFPLFVFSSQK